jgi:hypothetical protein
MVIKCMYTDEASRIKNFLRGNSIDSFTYEEDNNTNISISGRLSPTFIRLLFEFINDNKMKIEVSHE